MILGGERNVTAMLTNLRYPNSTIVGEGAAQQGSAGATNAGENVDAPAETGGNGAALPPDNLGREVRRASAGRKAVGAMISSAKSFPVPKVVQQRLKKWLQNINLEMMGGCVLPRQAGVAAPSHSPSPLIYHQMDSKNVQRSFNLVDLQEGLC